MNPLSLPDPNDQSREIYPILPKKQDEICQYIASGISEEDACAMAVVPYSDFSAAELMDGKFQEKLKNAERKRADHWMHKVVSDIDTVVGKDEAPGKKLQFEKLKWLAKIDNPEKYGDKVSTSIDIQHSIQISTKNMSVADARKILAEDPFSVPLEADYRVLEEEISKENPL